MANLAIKSENHKQLMLLPPSYEELVPTTHPVRVVDAIINKLDIKEIENSYKGGGNSCFNPKTMLKILIFAYLNNVHSSRKIEQQLKENVLYMWLSGGIKPDFRTINYFRSKRLKNRISDIFTKVVELLHENGFVSLNVQYIDGTKIESMANKYTFVWRCSIEKYDIKLKEKTRIILKQIQEQINFEEETDTELVDVDDFKDRVKKINKSLENKEVTKKIQNKIKKVEVEHIGKMQTYKEHLDKMEERNSYSKTDNDATFMRMKEDAMLNGQLKPGYNIQIATENQFITNYAIYQRPADTLTLIPFLKLFKERYGVQSTTVVADAGYGSEQNYEYLFNEDITPYVKFNYFHSEQKKKYKNNPFLPANLYYNEKENYYICPMGQHMRFVRQERRKSDTGYVSTISIYQAERCDECPLRCKCHKSKNNRVIEVNHILNQYKTQIRELLNSPTGLYHRSKRPIEPESVFGHIKNCGKFRRFQLQGLKGTEIEFGLKAIAHNIRKMALLWDKFIFSAIFKLKKRLSLFTELSRGYFMVKLSIL